MPKRKNVTKRIIKYKSKRKSNKRKSKRKYSKKNKIKVSGGGHGTLNSRHSTLVPDGMNLFTSIANVLDQDKIIQSGILSLFDIRRNDESSTFNRSNMVNTNWNECSDSDCNRIFELLNDNNGILWNLTISFQPIRKYPLLPLDTEFQYRSNTHTSPSDYIYIKIGKGIEPNVITPEGQIVQDGWTYDKNIVDKTSGAYIFWNQLEIDETTRVATEAVTEAARKAKEIEMGVDAQRLNSLIITKDAQISEKDAKISEQGAQISEKDAQISEQRTKISEQEAQISEQRTKISEQEAQISEKDAQISEKDEISEK